MAEERGYTRQVGTRAAAPMPMVSAESYGAGLGRQISATAATIHEEALQDYAIERRATANAEWAQFSHGFALHRENMAGISREARKDGSEGHAMRMGEAWDASRAALLDGITDDEVRQRALATFEESGVRFRTDEADFEDLARVSRTLDAEVQTANVQLNSIRRGDPKTYPDELDLGRARIAGYRLPADQERKALAEWDEAAATAFLLGRIDADPQMALGLIDSGVFDEVNPTRLEQLRNAADVEIRRGQAEAEHAANLARADLRRRVGLAKEAAGQGIDVGEQLPGLIAEAAAMGESTLALQLEGIQSDNGYAKIYSGVPPVQREQRMAMLEAHGARSAEEDRELKWLKDHQPSLDSRFNSDPAGFYARNGGAGAPPPLDITDPASVQERARWAATASAATGRPIPPLTENEARGLAATWQTGKRQDQLSVMDQLAQFPAAQAAAAARMVGPNDARLAVMVMLPAGDRRLALDGRDALKANRALLQPATMDDEEKFAEQRQRFQQALALVPPAERQAILEVGARIAAGMLDQRGGEFGEGLHWEAMNRALGATGAGENQRGGLARWGESWFLLPDGVTAGAFGAAVRDWAANGSNRPVNPDGSPASLQRAFPVFIGEGMYEFRNTAGDVVQGSKGGPWRVRVEPTR